MQTPVKEDLSYYQGTRPEVLAHVPPEAKRILDVGCGMSFTGRALKERGAEEVVGIELQPEVAKEAEKNIDTVLTGNVESLELPYPPDYFDCLLYGDILEHLRDPHATLKRHVQHLRPGGSVVACIPNVRYHKVLQHVIDGNWTYASHGILDWEHIRFFTVKEMVAMLQGAGLELYFVGENLDPDYEKAKAPSYPADISIGRMTLHGLSDFELRDLFVFQYILAARKK